MSRPSDLSTTGEQAHWGFCVCVCVLCKCVMSIYECVCVSLSVGGLGGECVRGDGEGDGDLGGRGVSLLSRSVG